MTKPRGRRVPRVGLAGMGMAEHGVCERRSAPVGCPYQRGLFSDQGPGKFTHKDQLGPRENPGLRGRRFGGSLDFPIRRRIMHRKRPFLRAEKSRSLVIIRPRNKSRSLVIIRPRNVRVPVKSPSSAVTPSATVTRQPAKLRRFAYSDSPARATLAVRLSHRASRLHTYTLSGVTNHVAPGDKPSGALHGQKTDSRRFRFFDDFAVFLR